MEKRKRNIQKTKTKTKPTTKKTKTNIFHSDQGKDNQNGKEGILRRIEKNLGGKCKKGWRREEKKCRMVAEKKGRGKM